MIISSCFISRRTIEGNDTLISLTHENLLLLWEDIEKHFPIRKQLISAAMLSLNDIEDDRLTTVSWLLSLFHV